MHNEQLDVPRSVHHNPSTTLVAYQREQAEIDYDLNLLIAPLHWRYRRKISALLQKRDALADKISTRALNEEDRVINLVLEIDLLKTQRETLLRKERDRLMEELRVPLKKKKK